MEKINSKNNNNKENKALKSVLIYIAIMISLGFLGYLSGSLIAKIEKSGVNFKEIFNNSNIYDYAVYIIPWIFVGSLLIVGGITIINYLKAKKSFKNWDGEDEESINKVEKTLSKSMMISNTALIVDYFLLAAYIYFTESDKLTLAENIIGINSTISMATFLISLIFYVVLQRAIVELEKKINPEKRGEVLNMNFQKEWEQSLDEAEMIMACKAGYKAFKAINFTCVMLWLLSVISQIVFDTGILPVLFVTVIWLVSTVTYQIEAIRLENKK